MAFYISVIHLSIHSFIHLSYFQSFFMPFIQPSSFRCQTMHRPRTAAQCALCIFTSISWWEFFAYSILCRFDVINDFVNRYAGIVDCERDTSHEKQNRKKRGKIRVKRFPDLFIATITTFIDKMPSIIYVYC